ncbi:RES domain-containing protein [Aurantimonas endophytica]|uniref:RES domain-containing protein n=1 Tax=Aurantimonas endophytica TaxID=1522175 RepID=A0A7W6HGE1_9HYPH|nr:hypothetical protein [Aurantimonas endophytica]MCO6405545.1 RES domain-containing protein [Aurantimonas endophytica]
MTAAVPIERVTWNRASRIIRSVFPPIDLFEDIAEPEDWPAILSAEMKTNPRLMESVGELDRVDPAHRVGGSGSSYLMAPFTHVSSYRASRLSDGSFGVLYVGRTFAVALSETIHHHAVFMAATDEPENWDCQFREIVIDVEAELHCVDGVSSPELLQPDDYARSQTFAAAMRAARSGGIRYPSVRCASGTCAALFRPDLASNAVQGRHLDYHWNGREVDFVRDHTKGKVFRVVR